MITMPERDQYAGRDQSASNRCSSLKSSRLSLLQLIDTLALNVHVVQHSITTVLYFWLWFTGHFTVAWSAKHLQKRKPWDYWSNFFL